MDPEFTGPLPLPDPGEIVQTAQGVLADPDYNLDASRYDLSPLLEWLGDTLAPVFRPLGKAFHALSDLSPLLAWTIVIVLVVVLVALVVHMVYSLIAAMRVPPGQLMPEFKPEQSQLLPETWEREAMRACEAGDFTEAARDLLRACLLWLRATRERPPRRGLTNREYLRLFGRTPVGEALAGLVDLVDGRWYAGGSISRADYEDCTAAHAAIRRWAEVNSHADAP